MKRQIFWKEKNREGGRETDSQTWHINDKRKVCVEGGVTTLGETTKTTQTIGVTVE